MAHTSNHMTSSTTMARHTLAATSMASVVTCDPVLRSAVWPLSRVTTLRLTSRMIAAAHSASAAAAHPRRLTGLCPPSRERKISAASVAPKPTDATLKTTLSGAWRRTTARTTASVPMQPRTRSRGERKTSPMNIGTASRTMRLVLPR